MEDDNEKISRIAGQIIISDSHGVAMKTWRERLQVKQRALAEQMDLSPSVLSDYESGRRVSPGAGFIKKYLSCLIAIDNANTKLLDKIVNVSKKSAIISIKEFKKPITANNFIKTIKGEIVSGENHLDYNIYGYTLLDSIKTIYALSGYDFYRIFGSTTERALIFTQVGLGRSPLVAIRVSQLKPRMVILHGPKIVDNVAVEIAKKENIILVISNLKNIESFENLLKNY